MTNQELLKKWEAGESVETVEMGGLGDDYEAAIQNYAFSLLKEYEARQLPKQKDLMDVKEYERVADDVYKNGHESFDGYTGAMVGVARNLAAVFYRKGYAVVMSMEDVPDRKIWYTNTLI